MSERTVSRKVLRQSEGSARRAEKGERAVLWAEAGVRHCAVRTPERGRASPRRQEDDTEERGELGVLGKVGLTFPFHGKVFTMIGKSEGRPVRESSVWAAAEGPMAVKVGLCSCC